MLKINWVDKISNEEVLDRIKERITLQKNLVKRRAQMIGHRLRHLGIFWKVRKKGKVQRIDID